MADSSDPPAVQGPIAETASPAALLAQPVADSPTPELPLERQIKNPPATWLPGVVLAWGAGLIVFGALIRGFENDPFARLPAAYSAFGLLFGYASARTADAWAVGVAPLAAAFALFIPPHAGWHFTLAELVPACGIMATGGVVLVRVRTFRSPGSIALAILALVAIAAFSPELRWRGVFNVVCVLLLFLCVSATTGYCLLFASIGSLLRAWLYRQRGKELESPPLRYWPARFTLRDMFRWTTWLAVIFAVLGALRLPPSAWLAGTEISLAAAAVAWSVVRLRSLAQRGLAEAASGP